MSLMFKIALKNLQRNRRRTFTLLLTIAIGCAALFLYHGFNYGIMNQYRANTIRALFGHGQINLKGYRDQVFEKPWEHWLENSEQITSYLESMDLVKHTFPRINFFAMLTNGDITVSGAGQGIDGEEEAKFFTQLNVESGKLLTDEPFGIILGKGLAHALKLNVGDNVTALANTVYGSLNGTDLKVVGIFHTGKKDFDDTFFRIQLKAAQTLLDTNKVESISVGLVDDDSWELFAEKFTKQFPHLDVTSFNVLDKVYYQHAVDFLWAQFDAIRSIILFIVILGIFNTVSTSVFERKQEIGNLRANGESRTDVLTLLGLEGLFIGVIGSVFGILIALVVNNTLLANGILMPPSPGITRQFYVFFELQPTYSMVIIVLGICSTVIATLLASIKVVKLPIAELLRSV